MTTIADDSNEDFLFHVVLEVIDYHKDPSGATRYTDVLRTFTKLTPAKEAARSSIKELGYLPDEFATYEEKTDPENWKHGDGVYAFAKAPNDVEFRVRVDTKPNVTTQNHRFKGNKEGEVEGHLHYVLQTIIDYNTDRTGAVQTTEIEGTYMIRKEAYEAAYKVLLDETEGITKESYEKYEERNLEDDVDWPYGEDVFVHAITKNGENYVVRVKVQPKSHQKHELKRPKKHDCGSCA